MGIETYTLTTRQPGPFPPGRRCSEPGCITVLCSYDEGPECFTCRERLEEPDKREAYERALATLEQAA